jgi:DNA-binding transcriptional ArsR family regulator
MSDDDLTPIWKALADPTRRKILDLLQERPRTTGDLCTSFKVSRFAVMKHLSVLEQAKLIVVRRRGRERWNYLNAVPLQRIYERWLRPFEASTSAGCGLLRPSGPRPYYN